MNLFKKFNFFYLWDRINNLEEALASSSNYLSELSSTHDEMAAQSCYLSSENFNLLSKVEELEKRLSECSSFPADYEELKSLVADHNNMIKENKDLTEKVDRLTNDLAVAKRKNDKWFEIVLSYAPDELIIVNQKLWGHQVELVKDIGKLKGDIK